MTIKEQNFIYLYYKILFILKQTTLIVLVLINLVKDKQTREKICPKVSFAPVKYALKCDKHPFILVRARAARRFSRLHLSDCDRFYSTNPGDNSYMRLNVARRSYRILSSQRYF